MGVARTIAIETRSVAAARIVFTTALLALLLPTRALQPTGVLATPPRLPGASSRCGHCRSPPPLLLQLPTGVPKVAQQLAEQARSAVTSAVSGNGDRQLPSIDWSCIDAAYVITCPQPDGSNPRLESAMKQLHAVGLGDLAEVRAFGTDDEDRVRGCYTSHIAVLEEAAERFADRPASEPLNVLVLEDNLSISPRIAQETLDAIASFLSPGNGGAAAARRDMVHLAYIMYVPGLSVERVPAAENIVRLQCNADSVLGTTAYIISRSGLDRLLAEHRRTGYVDAIPNLMARLFPDSRYAAFPMPLHRAATVKSLVNGQLDTLRALIFQPQVYTQWEKLLVSTGLSTNILFPSLCVLLLVGALAGGGEALGALAAAFRGEDVSLGLPLFSAVISGACLVVLGYGLALAPKPQTASDGEKS